jgi:hypothetical protein
MTVEQRDLTPEQSASSTRKPPKRDYVLLPLLSLATILVLCGTTEALTRIFWVEYKLSPCLIEDPIEGNRFKPNCTARIKIAESPWTSYNYNECGYLSETSCGPKPAGSLRIVILGSSVSQALHVPYEQSFFARASGEIRRACGRTVDVQNLGVPGASPIYAYRRVPEALALKPDVILYVLAPFDLEHEIDSRALAERDNAKLTLAAPLARLTLSPMKRLQNALIQERSVLVAQHFLFQNTNTFLKTYLLYGDKADFLREPLTAAWQRRFADLDVIVGGMANKAKAAGVPFVVMAVPSRAEAALLSSQKLPEHVDPFAFGQQVGMIASKHGAVYVDLMAPFSRVTNAESLYYVVDGHLTSEGQKLTAQSLSQKLLDGSIPVFSKCELNQTAREER